MHGLSNIIDFLVFSFHSSFFYFDTNLRKNWTNASLALVKIVLILPEDPDSGLFCDSESILNSGKIEIQSHLPIRILRNPETLDSIR